ncbi:hypothetical protein I552_4434 [Mycobacterium xenopi 3993]|nr:hypothetical protein I552_4434 [Mycobacterium xenopi 3993]
MNGTAVTGAAEHVGQQRNPTANDASAVAQPTRWPNRSVDRPPSSRIAAPAAGSATSSQVRCVIEWP